MDEKLASTSILNDTFCYYCQESFGPKLAQHILKKHPNTYASCAVIEAQEELTARKRAPNHAG